MLILLEIDEAHPKNHKYFGTSLLCWLTVRECKYQLSHGVGAPRTMRRANTSFREKFRNESGVESKRA